LFGQIQFEKQASGMAESVDAELEAGQEGRLIPAFF